MSMQDYQIPDPILARAREIKNKHNWSMDYIEPDELLQTLTNQQER